MAGGNDVSSDLGSVFVTTSDATPWQSAAGVATSAVPAAAVGMPSETLEQLPSRMLKAVTASADRSTALQGLAEIVVEQTMASQLLFCDQVTPTQFASRISWLSGQPIKEEAWLTFAGELCQQACREGAQQVRLNASAGQLLVAVPIVTQGRPPEILCAVLSAATTQPAERVAEILDYASSHVTLWYVLQSNLQAERHVKTSSALLDVLGQVEASENLTAGCLTLVNELQAFLGCHTVALGVRSSRRAPCQLQAISGHARFDRHARFVEAVEAAFEECLIQNRVLTYPPPRGQQDQAKTHSFQQLRDVLGCRSLIGAPLIDDAGRPVGAWLFVDPSETGHQGPDVASFAATAQQKVGVCLRLLQRGQRSWLAAKLHAARNGSHKARWLAAGAALLCAVILLALPFPHKIRCDCHLQPVQRRYVAAPFDGILKQALVEPGDAVRQGQVLALMDDRELRLEIASLTAEYDQARKAWESSLSVEDVAQSQQARLEMKRLQLKIDLLASRQDHLEIRSPLTGVVISGDLEKSQGAPLKVGQTLFEIAPRSEMVVEMEVPEPEIPYVRAGMPAEIRLEALPRNGLQSKVARIVPRAQVLDDRVVFIAKSRLVNPPADLRPGMSGSAQIRGGRRSLAWLLFHRPLESFLMMLGW